MLERRFTVVGKAHMAGTSKKTGDSYDFYVVYVVYPSSGRANVEGFLAGDFMCTEDFYCEVVPGTVFSDLAKSFDGLVCSGVPFNE